MHMESVLWSCTLVFAGEWSMYVAIYTYVVTAIYFKSQGARSQPLISRLADIRRKILASSYVYSYVPTYVASYRVLGRKMVARSCKTFCKSLLPRKNLTAQSCHSHYYVAIRLYNYSTIAGYRLCSN